MEQKKTHQVVSSTATTATKTTTTTTTTTSNDEIVRSLRGTFKGVEKQVMTILEGFNKSLEEAKVQYLKILEQNQEFLRKIQLLNQNIAEVHPKDDVRVELREENRIHSEAYQALKDEIEKLKKNYNIVIEQTKNSYLVELAHIKQLHDQEINIKNSRLNELLNQKRKLEDKFKEAKDLKNKNIRQQQELHQKRMEEMDREFTELKTKHQHDKLLFDKTHNKLKDLEESVKSTKSNFEEKRIDMQISLDKITEEWQMKYEQTEHSLREVNLERDSLQHEISVLEKRIRDFDQKIGSMSVRFNAEVEELRSSLRRGEERAILVDADITQLSIEKQKLESSREQIRRKEEEVSFRLKSYKAALRDQNVLLNTHKIGYSNTLNEVKQQQELKIALENTKSELSNYRSRLENEVDQLKFALESSKKKLNDLQKELEKVSNEKNNKQREFDKKKKELESVQEEIEMLKIELNRVHQETERTGLSHQISKMQLENKIKENITEKERIDREKSKLESDLLKKKSELQSLEEIFVLNKEKYAKLSQQENDKRTELDNLKNKVNMKGQFEKNLEILNTKKMKTEEELRRIKETIKRSKETLNATESNKLAFLKELEIKKEKSEELRKTINELKADIKTQETELENILDEKQQLMVIVHQSDVQVMTLEEMTRLKAQELEETKRRIQELKAKVEDKSRLKNLSKFQEEDLIKHYKTERELSLQELMNIEIQIDDAVVEQDRYEDQRKNRVDLQETVVRKEEERSRIEESIKEHERTYARLNGIYEENKRRNDSLVDIQEKLKEVEADLTNSRATLEQVTTNYEKIKVEKQNLTVVLKEKEDLWKELSAELRSINEELGKLTKDIEDIRGKEQKNSLQLETLKKREKELIGDLENKKNINERYEELKIESAKCEELKRTYDSIMEERQKCAAVNVDLENRLRSLQEKNKSLEATREALQAEYDRYADDLDKTRREIEPVKKYMNVENCFELLTDESISLRNEMNQLKARIKELQDSRENDIVDIDKHNEEVRLLEEEKKTQLGYIGKLIEELKSYSDALHKYNELTSTVKILEFKNKKLKEQTEVKNDDSALTLTCKNEMDLLEMRRKALEAEIHNLEKKYKSMCTDIAVLKSEKGSDRARIEQLQNEQALLKEEIESEMTKDKLLSMELAELERLRAENSLQDSIRESLKFKLEELTSQLEMIDKDSKNLSEEKVKEFEQQSSTLSQQIDELSDDTKKYSEKIKKLQEKIQLLTKEKEKEEISLNEMKNRVSNLSIDQFPQSQFEYAQTKYEQVREQSNKQINSLKQELLALQKTYQDLKSGNDDDLDKSSALHQLKQLRTEIKYFESRSSHLKSQLSGYDVDLAHREEENKRLRILLTNKGVKIPESLQTPSRKRAASPEESTQNKRTKYLIKKDDELSFPSSESSPFSPPPSSKDHPWL